MDTKTTLPDEMGHYGQFGGRYVSETLMPAILQLEEAYKEIKNDPKFHEELNYYFSEYVGRPT
ncbi:MAG: tryptophan synthase subunit beta, partial [Thermodesulfobacteriota bacterium]